MYAISFNRPIVELKFKIDLKPIGSDTPFNRPIVELKSLLVLHKLQPFQLF